jgi:hypothetical protein
MRLFYAREAAKFLGVSFILALLVFTGMDFLWVYLEYAQLREHAQSITELAYLVNSRYHGKLYTKSIVPKYYESEIMNGHIDPFRDFELKISIYQCDNDDDGKVDDPLSIRLANNADGKHFADEFAKCGSVGGVVQAPYVWTYVQRQWMPLGGNLIGVQPFNLTALESNPIQIYNLILITDFSTIATISDCNENLSHPCTPYQNATLQALKFFTFPHDHLHLIVLTDGRNSGQPVEDCSLLPLSDVERLGCHSKRFRSFEDAQAKTLQLVSTVRADDLSIFLLLTRSSTMADTKNFIQTNLKVLSANWTYFIGCDDRNVYSAMPAKDDWQNMSFGSVILNRE